MIHVSTESTTQYFIHASSVRCDCSTYHLCGAGASIPNRQIPNSAHSHANRTDWAMVHRHQSQLNLLQVLSKCHLFPLKCVLVFFIFRCPVNYASCFSCTDFSFFSCRKLPGRYPPLRCAFLDESIFCYVVASTKLYDLVYSSLSRASRFLFNWILRVRFFLLFSSFL